jgi:hypothetical protein
MGKVIAAGALAVGYVLGPRAGRERYEQVRRAYAEVMGQPVVHDAVIRVEDRLLNRYNT